MSSRPKRASDYGCDDSTVLRNFHSRSTDAPLVRAGKIQSDLAACRRWTRWCHSLVWLQGMMVSNLGLELSSMQSTMLPIPLTGFYGSSAPNSFMYIFLQLVLCCHMLPLNSSVAISFAGFEEACWHWRWTLNELAPSKDFRRWYLIGYILIPAYIADPGVILSTCGKCTCLSDALPTDVNVQHSRTNCFYFEHGWPLNSFGFIYTWEF